MLKCQLKPIDAKDYKAPMTADEMQQLRQAFPGGVCDYSKAGVNQVPPGGHLSQAAAGAPAPSSTAPAQR